MQGRHYGQYPNKRTQGAVGCVIVFLVLLIAIQVFGLGPQWLRGLLATY